MTFLLKNGKFTEALLFYVVFYWDLKDENENK